MNQLENLKTKLKENRLDGYLVPIRDEFGCEYVPAQNRRLEYITGFTGSNAFAVVGKESSAFFTDGRYTIQAKMEVDKKNFNILDMVDIKPEEWIVGNFKAKAKIGYDAALFSIAGVKRYQEKLAEKNIKLVELESNLIDEVWKDRPKAVETKAFIHEKKFCGEKAADKIKRVSAKIKGDMFLLTSAESICWLLNIRANDLPHTPVLLSYALITKKGDVYLYCNSKAVGRIEDKIDGDVHVRELKDIYKDIKKYSGKKFELDENQTSIRFKNLLEANNCAVIETADIVLSERAIKNKTEIEAMKNAHVRDGVALCRFLAWVEGAHEEGAKLDEISISDTLEDFRKEGDNFFSLSFDTIAGWKKNGAIIHYRADEESAAEIKGSGVLLVDSGAQYLDGTTDVTRTIVLGKPTAEQKRNFTLVLKGHIALSSQRFVKGTSGGNLDILARKALWNEGLDYKHGTGHGVGFFLNVHEGPQNLKANDRVPLMPGMIISNEPGYYKEGEYGIRTESLLLVVEAKAGAKGLDDKSVVNKGGNGTDGKGSEFFEFVTLTKVPIDKNLIDKALLNQEEVDWLNNYHNDVYDSVEGFLNKVERSWLRVATSKI